MRDIDTKAGFKKPRLLFPYTPEGWDSFYALEAAAGWGDETVPPQAKFVVYDAGVIVSIAIIPLVDDNTDRVACCVFVSESPLAPAYRHYVEVVCALWVQQRWIGC